MSRFRLSFDSSLSNLFAVSALVRSVCDSLGMPVADTSSVDVCAVEAVTNAIKHAYLCAPGNEVCVEIRSTPERLDLYVSDQGRSMPAEQAIKLRRGSRVLEFDPTVRGTLPEGGMGLQIIHELMDEASYSSEGGTNVLRLTRFVRACDSREAGA